MSLPDIQKTDTPLIVRYIDSVGVSKVKVPFKIQEKSGKVHETIAKVSMNSDLQDKKKGISMSRFIRTLKNYLDTKLDQKTIRKILSEFKVKNNSNHTFINFEFDLPVIKKSPKSDNKFPEYYKCKFGGSLCDDCFRFFQSVKVYYSSYCPCSAALCSDLKSKGLSGFPHAQRSFAILKIENSQDKLIWLEDLITLIEKSVINIPYPIIKRVDEQEIARIAGNHPIFVEDAIRSISSNLDKFEGIKDWIVKCVHNESIHTSNAVSCCWKGIQDGFDEKSLF